MKADIAFLNATLTPVNPESTPNGFASGFVNIDSATFAVTVSLFYGGLFPQTFAGAGIFGPSPNTDLTDQIMPPTPNEIFGLLPRPGQLTDGSASGTGTFDQTTFNDLEEGKYFFNLYVNDPILALRGQILLDHIGPGQILPTPEPAAWAMLLVCIGFAARTLRRRRIAG
jgi:hypothetical protein